MSNFETMEQHVSSSYYDWSEIYPQLKILKDNIEAIKLEAENIHTVTK